MTTAPFAEATAVTPAGAGTWQAAIPPGWDIGGNANGGYLLAIGARALVAATGRPDPVSMTGHYLSPGKPGPVAITTTVHKEGRRFATASARLEAGGKPLLAVLGTCGDLSDRQDDLLVDGAPPALPAPDECLLVVATDTFPPPFMGKVELRLHPEDAGFATGVRSGVARVRGWFRLPHDEPVDTGTLVCALDAFPPTIFNTDLPVGWVPTVELTTHVRARPDPGWLRCRFTTRYVTGGFLEVDGDIWDGRDRLVAQSRQLALVPLD
jgi:acyl-coenzyme A thioesterase PaaI-like protein